MTRGVFPLGFGWQPATSPPAIGLRFVRIDVAGWVVKWQRFPLPEPAMLPVSWTIVHRLAPAVRFRQARMLQPRSAFVGPPALVAVAVGRDELCEFSVARALTVDTRRRDPHRVAPFLVVEQESAMLGSAHQERLAADRHIA